MKTFADFNIESPESGRTLCPQCSPTRHKSYEQCLSVDFEKGVWFCHHCGWTGGLGGEFDKKEIERYFTKPHFVESECDEKAVKWFKSRGISEKTLAAAKIKTGMAWMHGKDGGGEVNCVQFPFFVNGECINIKYRSGDKRFRQSKNARKTFYGFDSALRSKSDTLICVEGEMDQLSLCEVGLTCSVSVPDGAPTPNTKNFTSKFDFLEGSEILFEGRKWIVLAGDNDEPGKHLVNELSRRIGIERCKVATWPSGCKDANDVLVKHGASALRQCIDQAKPFPVDSVVSMGELTNKICELKTMPPKTGVNMCWQDTMHLWNVELGQITFVTGIPSHGKSTWLDYLRVGLWGNHGWSSAACSPENWPAENHAAILLEMYAMKNFYGMDYDTTMSAMSELENAFFFLQPEDENVMLDVDTILAKAKALIFRHGLKVLIMDPWNEIEHSMKAGEREDQYISRQLAKIRRFARMHNIHIFIVAHPTKLQKEKNGDYPIPTAYDIAGGAMWRNKADNIICVHRPDMRNSITDVYIQKVRFRRNGKVSALTFNFHVETSTYHYQGEKE